MSLIAILLVIIAILFSVFVTIRPFKIGRFHINMATGSLISLILLIFVGIIDIPIIQSGILGNGQLKPWEIIIIFFTVAYVSISTDITGIFDYLAYKIVNKANGNGRRLFFFFFLFAGILTVFTSNDIVILTLTPIIFYLGGHAHINVIPLLFAEFFGANTMSMFLYIGNPTNIIVGNALGLGFLEYTKIMWLPTIIAAAGNYLMLSLVFRKDITSKYRMKANSNFSIRNWYDAIISSILLIAMLIFLAFSQSLNIPIWVVTIVFALIFIIEDIFFGIYYTFKGKWLTQAQIHINKTVYHIPKEKNGVLMTVKRIPWKILPFMITLFIFVETLNSFGFVDLIASIISSFSKSLGAGIATMGVLGIILANIINNQPMTIFLTNVLISDSFIVNQTTFVGSAYALVIASNLGANITLIGALAGLMWKRILETKGIHISYFDFLRRGILITTIVFTITLAVLFLVLR